MSNQSQSSKTELRDRCLKTIEWCRNYEGPDMEGALSGELDCLIELQLLEDSDAKPPQDNRERRMR